MIKKRLCAIAIRKENKGIKKILDIFYFNGIILSCTGDETMSCIERLRELEQEYSNIVKEIKQMKTDKKVTQEIEKNFVARAMLCRKIVYFSRLGTKDIVDSIIDVMRAVEGKSYVANYDFFNYENSERFIEGTFIIENDCVEDNHTISYFNTMIEQGKAIILYDDNNITKFYKLNNNLEVTPTINFGKFDYIKEFIDYTISFKLENNITTLPSATLEELTKKFIILKLAKMQNKKTSTTLELDSSKKRMSLS